MGYYGHSLALDESGTLMAVGAPEFNNDLGACWIYSMVFSVRVRVELGLECWLELELTELCLGLNVQTSSADAHIVLAKVPPVNDPPVIDIGD